MKKLKIYLDTSVSSHLQHEDAPDKTADTLRLWEEIKAGKYAMVISDVTLDEIARCPEPKRTTLDNYLKGTDFSLAEVDNEVKQLAQQFIANNILSKKSFDDCLHIASAVVHECDIIVSWNFKHIVNYKTIKGVKVVSLLTGYKEVEIYSPTILIEGGDNE